MALQAQLESSITYCKDFLRNNELLTHRKHLNPGEPSGSEAFDAQLKHEVRNQLGNQDHVSMTSLLSDHFLFSWRATRGQLNYHRGPQEEGIGGLALYIEFC